MNEIVLHSAIRATLMQLQAMTAHVESLNSSDEKVAKVTTGLVSAERDLHRAIGRIHQLTDSLERLTREVDDFKKVSADVQRLIKVAWILACCYGASWVITICALLFHRH